MAWKYLNALRPCGTSVRLLSAALILVTLTGCRFIQPQEPAPSPSDPNLSFRLRMQVRHFRNGVLTKEQWASNQSVSTWVYAQLPGPGGGSITTYPARISNSEGWVQPRYDNAFMPAIWRAVWNSSTDYPGCSGLQRDFQMPSISWYHFIYQCDHYEYGMAYSENYGVDIDGNTIWTGGSDKVLNDEFLWPGDSRTSADGRFQLIYQNDGNFVLYGPSGAMWAINCWPGCSDIGPPGHVHNQDGNLVVYNGYDQVVWASNTGGWYGAGLTVQSDGNTVMYEPYGMALWETGTGGWIY
jgi:hypothetical protein